MMARRDEWIAVEVDAEAEPSNTSSNEHDVAGGGGSAKRRSISGSVIGRGSQGDVIVIGTLQSVGGCDGREHVVTHYAG
jgi:hypothetical protein